MEQNQKPQQKGSPDDDDTATAAARAGSPAKTAGSDDHIHHNDNYIYRDLSHIKTSDLPEEDELEAAPRTLPAKLNAMLSDPALKDVITWLPHGRSWRILDRDQFTDEVLPTYFEHSNYHSFVRLVNAWGFRRVPFGIDGDSYYHELFLRGMPHLHAKMKRLLLTERKTKIESKNRCPNFYAMPIPDGVSQNSDENENKVSAGETPTVAAVGKTAKHLSTTTQMGGNKMATSSHNAPFSGINENGGIVESKRPQEHQLSTVSVAPVANPNMMNFLLPPNISLTPPQFASTAPMVQYQLPNNHQLMNPYANASQMIFQPHHHQHQQMPMTPINQLMIAQLAAYYQQQQHQLQQQQQQQQQQPLIPSNNHTSTGLPIQAAHVPLLQIPSAPNNSLPPPMLNNSASSLAAQTISTNNNNAASNGSLPAQVSNNIPLQFSFSTAPLPINSLPQPPNMNNIISSLSPYSYGAHPPSNTDSQLENHYANNPMGIMVPHPGLQILSNLNFSAATTTTANVSPSRGNYNDPTNHNIHAEAKTDATDGGCKGS